MLSDLGIKSEVIIKYVSQYGIKILAAFAIFFFGRMIARFARNAIKAVLIKGRVDTTLSSFISNVAYAAMVSLVVIAAINKLGINTTSLAAIIGAAGLAVGLAFQNSLSNIASGIMIIVLRPFKVGQHIEIGAVSGTVQDIDILTTELRTADNKLIIIPNSQITNDKIINHSANNTRRIDMVIGISYNDDLKKAKTILEEIIADEKRILNKPAPFVGVAELGSTKVNIAVRPWVKTSDYDDVKCSLLENIKERFHAEGITIPFEDETVIAKRKIYAAK